MHEIMALPAWPEPLLLLPEASNAAFYTSAYGMLQLQLAVGSLSAC
jgi:hypothetical protein